MAGAGESGLTDSLLETPTYVLSIVFMMFLAISGAFEITHHFAHKWLVRRGRLGMAEALDKLVMELTLLGFVSLVLTAFASPLSHICIDYESSMDKWTIESGIPGCPCCMANTGGLSYCSMIQHECMWNVTSRAAFCDCDVTGSAAYYDAPDSDAQNEMTSEDCLIFDANEVTFFIESSVNTLASLSVFTNTSVTEICGLIDSEFEVAQARQEMGLQAELAEAGIDPAEGIVLPWDESSGWRRRLQADGGSSSGGGGTRQRRRLHGPDPAAGAHRQLPMGEQPAAPLGPHQHGRRLLGGDLGDRLTDPLSVLAAARSGNPTSPSEVHVLPRAKLFKCTGPFLSSGCPNGKVPAISANALHQVHIWLFLIAITHVGSCVFQFLVAAARILLWRRWERLARQSAMPRGRAALAASTAVALAQEADAKGLKEGSGKVEEPALANGAPPGHAQAAAADAAAAAAAAASAGQAEQGAAASAPTAAASAAAGGDSQAVGARSQPRPRSLQKLRSRARFVWKFQPADIHEWGASGWLMELAICMTQALWPNLVTRQNFILMRKAWLAAGAQSKRRLGSAPSFGSSGSGSGGSSGGGSGERRQPNFVGHVLECLEGDLSTFVGLSVEMSICLVVVVLLMGVTGNIGGLTLVALACTLMFLTNVALVAMLRHQCRGAQPYCGRGQWWRNPRAHHFVLAIPLRLLTFLCSFVFSSTALFAWQFGSKSCFFTNTWGLWSLWSLPWWSGLVVAGVILLWASAATIPAYALAAHSHRRTSEMIAAGGHHHGAGHGHDQPSKQQHELELPVVANENGSSAAESALQAEVGRLQAHVSQLEAQVAQLQARLAAEQPAA